MNGETRPAHDRSTIIKTAFIKALPIICSYVFIALAYGMTMEESGFGWLYSMIISMFIYTGAYQFVLVTFLASGTPILTVALTALLMNSRQSFYSITFLNDFKQMGRRKLYMIHTLTDETYAVNCTLDAEPVEERHEVMFWVAVMSWCSWWIASLLGGVIGQLIPMQLDGIDFCMTALFVIIFIDQWEKAAKHIPAITGLSVGVICLVIFGASSFMLPALLITSAILIVLEGRGAKA